MRLAQVFLNLLNNACKYTESGGRIELTAELDGTDVVVKVKDSGIGIPAEHLPHLFELFSQVGSTLEQSQRGLGIGLWLARGVVERHGGGIEAKSEGPGKGSEFVVRLPTLGEAGAPQPLLPACRDSFHAAAPQRILVADDSPDVVASLALLQRLRGYEVETACDGFQAVEAAARYRPDVALLDIGMPKLDGYAACRRSGQRPGAKIWSSSP
jgi:hypothetical protein